MKVRLTKDARIKHYAGEIVEVSLAEYNFLTSTGSAVSVHETAAEVSQDEDKPKTTTTRRKTAK